MTAVWITALDGILVRRNSIALIRNSFDGLYVDTVTESQSNQAK